ncbi:MAG: HIT family protein [bacterium]|nr:HIT family protein [bacterium]
MTCIFCQIAKKELPNHTVYEDDAVLAFLDVHPCAKGHTVVIPKKHFEQLSDLKSKDWDELMQGVRGALEKVEAVLHPAGVNIGINDRPAAGQMVSHVHWHIFPRWANDGGSSAHAIIQNGEDIDVAAVAELFKK